MKFKTHRRSLLVTSRNARRPSRRETKLVLERLEGRNLMAGLQLSVLSSYFAPGGATAEIGAYDSESQRVFYTSATSNALGIVDISNPAIPSEVAMIDLSPYGGGPNSVAVKGGLVAVAVEATVKTDPGSVLFFTSGGVFLQQVTVGALPDMLVFTADGKKVLVANEGEPNSYNQLDSVDPEGSISIVDLSNGLGSATVATAGFAAWNGPAEESALLAAGVRIYGPNASVAQDLEPEYIATSPDGATAYVTLQENNALATIDISSATVTEIKPLGFKDHNSGAGLDASDRDVPGSSNNGILNIRNWPVFGMYQPDAIAAYEVDGATYLLTANEGDARDYTGFAEESRVGALTLDGASFAAQGFPDVSTGASGLRNNDNLGRLNVTTALGNTDADPEFEELYSFGARSFSIWDAEGDLVFDSGDDFEQVTAAAFPGFFNASNEDNSFDSRSDNKGPEPEAVIVAEIAGRSYAFLGLERIGGIMVYDVTDPMSPTFVQYINNRDFTQPTGSDLAKDLGLEDLKFIPADESPTGTPLVMTVNEISGTVTLFAIELESGAAVTDDGVLAIIGTAADDRVEIKRQGHQIRVEASFLSPTRQSFPISGIESIHVILGAGNDRLDVHKNVDFDVVAEGWAGNDAIVLGGGSSTALGGHGNDLLYAEWENSVLVGGRGNDLLNGGRGRSILIGGEGSDLLLGAKDQDLLVGGKTAYDANLDALAALRNKWSGPGSFVARKQSLQTGISSAHGTVKLVAGETVYDDASIDLLFGGPDQDWLIQFLGDLGL